MQQGIEYNGVAVCDIDLIVGELCLDCTVHRTRAAALAWQQYFEYIEGKPAQTYRFYSNSYTPLEDIPEVFPPSTENPPFKAEPRCADDLTPKSAAWLNPRDTWACEVYYNRNEKNVLSRCFFTAIKDALEHQQILEYEVGETAWLVVLLIPGGDYNLRTGLFQRPDPPFVMRYMPT